MHRKQFGFTYPPIRREIDPAGISPCAGQSELSVDPTELIEPTARSTALEHPAEPRLMLARAARQDALHVRWNRLVEGVLWIDRSGVVDGRSQRRRVAFHAWSVGFR
jgi:hypothetical protein